MKNVDVRMRDHLHSEVTTLCTLWELIRRDGEVFRWTDHDDDVTYDGHVYESADSGGFDRSALETGASMDVSNAEMVGFLGSGLAREELNAGLFDYAKLNVRIVNWADPTMSAVELRSGTLGEVLLTDTDQYRVEFRGLQQPYKQIIGEVYTPECRANFGDTRCKKLLADYLIDATVLTAPTRKTFTARIDTPMIAVPPAGMMDYGIVKFLTGANAGKTMEIKSYSESVVGEETRMSVTLKFPLPYGVDPETTIEVMSGCDQRYGTCMAYENIINFRGEPFLPGEANMFKNLGRR